MRLAHNICGWSKFSPLVLPNWKRISAGYYMARRQGGQIDITSASASYFRPILSEAEFPRNQESDAGDDKGDAEEK